MALSDLSDPDAVVQAIREYDKLGQESFLAKYGFGPSRQYRLVHDGQAYDLKAVLAAAHGFQFPSEGPIRPGKSFTSGLGTTVPKAEELGFEIDRGHEEELGATSRPKRAWIFQANPRYYDIESAIRALDEMNWSVKQSPKQITAGDRLYIWKSGEDAGVIAIGTILTDPAMLPEQEGPQFILDESVFKGEALRIRLRIDDVLDPPITRETLREHPVLKNLGIIKFANATNYGLNEEQDAALQDLIGDRGTASLEARVEEWLRETGYPTERDKDLKHRSRREQVAKGLSRENLERVIEDPDQFDILEFRALASDVYGDPGNQARVNAYLKNGGTEERRALARTIQHLLYGTGDVVERLNDVLENPEWKVSGFSEVLATKALAVVYPEQWLPLFRIEEGMGKLRVAESPELEISLPDNFLAWSYGQRIKWTNDVLRDAVAPYISDDPWGQMVFLYWLRKQHDKPATAATTVWWVNQGTHYREERDGGFIWAPLVSKSGSALSHWTSLREADEGDLVLNYANGRIRAVSTVVAPAAEASRPDGLSGEAWEENGLMVRLRYTELSESVGVDEIPIAWRMSQGAPFTRQGSVQQGYFFQLGPEFVSQMASRFPQLGLLPEHEAPGEDYAEPAFEDIASAVREAGMVITDQMLRRFHLSLKTRGFVVLSGVSGTGKTWLARLYANAVNAASLVVSVAPNWTTNEDLLGFRSPINGEFQETEFTRFLRRASEEWQKAQEEERSAKPFHLILDEMNLAHVEYYFAKFLSAMEVRATDGTAELELVPGVQVTLPRNLLFIGTVNVDETTRGFADKVYDRAQLIELRITREQLQDRVKGAAHSNDLLGAWDALHEVAPFAFRVVDEIAAYIDQAVSMNRSWEEAFDEQLLQKVLPKVKGGDQRIGGSLDALLELADSRFPMTHDKAKAMRDAFTQYGFTSYF